MIYRILFIAFLFYLANPLQAQNEDLVKSVARKACDCMETKDLNGISSEQLNMELGLCIMGSLDNGADGASQLDLDFSDQKAMHAFGEKVGIHMVSECPSLMMKIVSTQQVPENNAATSNKLVGTFKGVQGEDFAFLTLEGEDGSTYRLLWLQKFEGAELLESAKNKRVEISFREIECYAPKMKKYLTRKEVLSMSIL